MYSKQQEEEFRASLIEVARLCYARRYICGTEGNFSIRLAEDVILTTPAGSCKGRVRQDELVLTSFDGNPLPGQSGKPSTELSMHITCYRVRPEIKAVVHAHPTVAVGFTVAGQSLSKCVLPEVVCTLGTIPTAPYATPSTPEVSESIEAIIKERDALVLDHHGALAVGSSIWDAYYKLETLEHHAETMLVAHMLGGVQPLSSNNVQKLLDICHVYGLPKPANSEAMLDQLCISDSDGEASP